MIVFTIDLANDDYSENWAKLPNRIAQNPNVTGNAAKLYWVFVATRPGLDISEKDYQIITGLSDGQIYRAKKNLRENGYLVTHRTSPRKYEFYLGNGELSANEVKDLFLAEKAELTGIPVEELEV